MRPSLIAIGLVLMLGGCASRPVGLPPDTVERLSGRAIVTAESEAQIARRTAANVSNPTPITAPLAGTLVSLIGQFNENNRTTVGAVPDPTRDPARLARTILVDYLVASRGAVRGQRPLDATGIAGTTAATRAPELFARARTQGFPGVIVDLHPTALRIRSKGVGIGWREERFYLDFAASFALIDAKDGRILVRSGCDGRTRARSYTLSEITRGGAALLDEVADLAAMECAAEIITRDLLVAP